MAVQLNKKKTKFLNLIIVRVVQIEEIGNIPFVMAIVFLLHCVDLVCNGLYDCFTIIDKLAGDVDVACARCSNVCSLL